MKLSLSKILKEMGYGRPEGPSAANRHHYDKHPKSVGHQYFDYSSNDFPYIGQKSDEQIGMAAAKEGEDVDYDDEIPLESFSRFTQQGRSDAPSVAPWVKDLGNAATRGRSGADSYGRSQFATFDPSDADNDERMNSFTQRAKTKVNKYEVKKEYRARGMHPRDSSDSDTSEPYASGIKKTRSIEFHPQEIEKEFEFLKPEEKLKSVTRNRIVKTESRWADTNYNGMIDKKKADPVNSDLNYWDNVNLTNYYLMNTEEEIRDKNKKQKARKRAKNEKGKK